MFCCYRVKYFGCQKSYHRKFILKEQQQITEETAANFKDGIETEVNAIATVVSLLLPALLPPYCTFIEVSPRFVNTQERQCMLKVSPNGIIKCCYDENNCPNNCAAVCNGITIEMKCPVSDSPYYNYRYYIPKRYVPQVMSEMFTQETSKGWFIVCSSDSVSILEFECNEEIWAQISAILVDLYGKEDKETNEIATKHSYFV